MNTLLIQTDRVLVIDDDAILREVLSLLLGAEGHEVSAAESGDAALALLSRQPAAVLPSVVLTDLKMPGVSHAALAMALRVTCPPPTLIIAMSASEAAPDEVVAFDAFLRKPFTMRDYDAAVERARGQSPDNVSSGIAISIAAAAEEDSDTERYNPQSRVLNETIYAKLSSVMGPAELPPLYTLFLDDALARSERMAEAAAGNDQVTFSREAHAIKGGCGMLGATELYSLARRMETGGLACSTLLNDFQPALVRLRRILDKRITLNVNESSHTIAPVTDSPTRR